MPFDWKKISGFILCIAVLMTAAFYNGYPLVTSDTGTYINSAFTFDVARDRPFGYSILIALTSLKFSLWLTICVQCVLIYFLMYRTSKIILGVTFLGFWKQLFIISSTAIFTGVTWYAGMIMPDVFTAIGGISFLLFLLDNTQKMKVYYALILIFSITTHTSHLLIFSLLSICSIIYTWRFQRENIKDGFYLAAICFACWLIVPGLHYAVDQNFKINQSTHVFLTGRFLESGTLQRYLRKECPDNPIGLCLYKDALPQKAIDFIWDGQSPLYKTKGWEDPNGEYRKMTRKILTTPKYCLQFLYSSVFSSMSQLIQTDIGDGLTPHVAESNPYWKVLQYYSYELPTYLNSLQNTSRLHYEQSNKRYSWAVVISFLFLSWILFGQKRLRLQQADKLTLFMVLALIILNAFVTATFGNVLARLQSRVVWLLPFIAILFALKYYNAGIVQQKE
jgi:hypothetical protein